ncbi:pectinesterase family protein [Paraburkholderia sp. EG286B]|uniref:pectinesterase family protein n=1 Tax=Paraburkholderia sp. EG286B TaxID=3237011 RepID=UPI0034D1AFE5
MSKLFRLFVLHGTAIAGLYITAASAQTCSNEAECRQSAGAKQIQLLTPVVVPIQYDYPKLIIHNHGPDFDTDYQVPNGTTIVYDFYTDRNSFNLPSQTSIITNEIARLDPAKGFTILVIHRTRDNFAAGGGASVSLLSSADNTAYASFMLGSQPSATGQKWSFGKSLLQSKRPQTAYWQKPWDMNILGPTGSFSGTEWVYYTFTPDGKVKIDLFAPYTYSLAFTAYQWDEAVLDSGFPHFAYEAGGPTSRPNQAPFGSVGPLMVGAVNVPGQGSPTLTPVQALPGFERAVVFSGPLSNREIVAFQKSLKGSLFLDVDMLPCNSGAFLAGEIRTPCGKGSPGNPPADVSSITPVGLNTNVDPKGVTLAANDGGGGSFSTIKAAVDALPPSGGVIRIPLGVYTETLDITKPNVKLIGTGTDASQVLITGNHSANATDPGTGQPYGTAGSYTVAVDANDVYLSNLTIRNSADYEAPDFGAKGQAVALRSNGDRDVYRTVRLLGGQDTLYVNGPGRAYFSNCYVEGNVDYIFGNGKAVFDGCTLKTKIHDGLIGEATITAQKRESASEDSSFGFDHTKSPYMSNAWLGRPWGSHSTVYFLNSTMGPQLTSDGWIEFIPPLNGLPGTNNLPTSTYREYNTRYADMNGQGAAPFDIGQRETTSPKSNVALSSAEAAALAPDIYLAGTDGWQPTLVSDASPNLGQQVPVPTPAAGVPQAPLISATVGGNGNVQVTWAGQPANPAETGYVTTARQHGKSCGPFQLPAYAYSGYVEVAFNGSGANSAGANRLRCRAERTENR